LHIFPKGRPEFLPWLRSLLFGIHATKLAE
jgi:hypothetical protein